MRFFSFRRLKVPVHQTIHKDCRVEGTLHFKGGLLIEGTVKGDLHGADTKSCITVGKHGSLSTSRVRADILIVNGTLQADSIQARQVVLGAGSKVKAAILQGDLVEIHTGAQFEGSVDIRGETPKSVPLSENLARGTAVLAKDRLLRKAEAEAVPASAPMTQGS